MTESGKPPPVLDYAGPAPSAEEDAAEAERLRAIRAYNEATFGEGEPFGMWTNLVVGFSVYVVTLPVAFALPKWLDIPQWSAHLLCLVCCLLLGLAFANWGRIRDAAVQWIEVHRR